MRKSGSGSHNSGPRARKSAAAPQPRDSTKPLLFGLLAAVVLVGLVVTGLTLWARDRYKGVRRR